MDSGEWRYVQRDGEEARTGESDPGAPPAPAPDLWDDDSPAWGSAWVPEPRRPEPTETTAERPAGWPGASGPPGWDQPGPGAPAWGDSRNGSPAWGGNGSPGWGEAPAPAAPQLPSPGAPPAPATSPLPPPAAAPRPADSSQYSPYGAPGSSGPRGSYVRTGVDNWVRPEARGRRRPGETDEYRVVRPQRDAFGDEPAYGPVLGLTAAWYGVPAVFYLVWLVTLDSDRQSLVGRTFAASLPWLLAAIVLSLAVAGLLRWAVVGWRAMTLSFASAVIGAGVTTIAHSLTL